MIKKNKQFLVVFVAIIVLLLITLGGSVAFFNYAKEGTTENSIELGSITFKYTENQELGNGILITDAFPISDEEGKIKNEVGEYFDFKVESTLSRSDLEYEVVASPTEDSTLPLDAIKFYLTDTTSGTEEEIETSINEDGSVKTLEQYSDTLIKNASGKTIYQETILRNTKGYEKHFRARMWISEDIDWSDDNYMNKSGAIRINVYANSDRDMAATDTTSPVDTSIERVVANDKYLFTKVTQSEKYQYTVTVPNEVDTVDIDVIANNMGATVEIEKIESLAFDFGSSKGLTRLNTLQNQITQEIQKYSLKVGENFFKAIVTSSDDSKSQEYILRIIREESINTHLKSLEVEGYNLNPEFSNNLNLYEVEVPYEIENVNVIAELMEVTQTVTGLGNHSLNIGTNVIEVVVEAENGIKRTIQITVNRALSSDSSIANVGVVGYELSHLEGNIYTVTIPYNVDSIEIINKSTTGATVNGIGLKENIDFETTDYNVEVVSASGLNKSDYVIRVIKEKDTDNTLKSLSLTNCTLSPEFNKDVISYSCTVENNITSTTVSALANSSVATITGEGNKTLDVGNNTINVVVKAQNGLERTYQVIVNRKASSDATLKTLSVTGYEISPEFNSSKTEYTLSVLYNVTSVDIVAEVNNSEASLTGTGSKSLDVGDNTFTITVTAGDGSKKDYKITVTRQLDTDNTLKSLSLTDCELVPDFEKGVTAYTCTVENNITSTTVSAVANSSEASVDGIGNKTLAVGNNTITVSVTSQSGEIKTYTVTVTRKKSSDATLKSLSVTGYQINPEFNSSKTDYTLSVLYNVESVEVVAEVNNSEAKVKITGNSEFKVGDNQIIVNVTAGDGTTKDYTILVTRQPDTDNTLKSLSLTGCTLSPTFNKDVISYSCTVENNITSTTVTAVANSSVATITGEGNKTLDVGNNTISVVVKAQNGLEKTYQVIVNRKASSDATLKSLSVTGYQINPEFNSSKTEYTLSVLYNVTNVEIVAEVNNSEASLTGTGSKSLDVGDNTFTITVTAGDGTNKDYKIVVTRQPDTDNTLSSLSLTNCTLSPEFNSSKTEYTCTVENNITSTTVTATANSSVASVSGTGNKTLDVGKNTINVSVTSQSGSLKTYQVIVNRKASSDATLKSLSVTGYQINPEFNSSKTEYTLSVLYSVESVTLNAEVNNSEASLTGTGNKPLDVGNNTFTITVTAGDGTTKDYTILVTRQPDTDNTLSSLSLTNCTLSPDFNKDVISYSCTVANNITSTTVTALANSSVASVSGTGNKALDVGNNTISISVTSQSGSKKTYTVVVNRLPNSDPTLKSLGVTNQTLSPAFSKDELEYTVSVPYSVDNITITGTATQSVSTVTGLGNKALSVGNNTFEVVVTAEDTITKRIYKITVTRQPDTDTSLKSISVVNHSIVKVDNNHYTLTVANNITSVVVNAEANSSVAIVTGTGSKSLDVGTNIIKVTVTAQSGAISTYEVAITRLASSDANLKSLSVSGYTISPTFASGTTSYTLTVGNSVSSVTVNAEANNSEASVSGTGSKSLNTGANTITVTVTAGNGATKKYTITITRKYQETITIEAKSVAYTGSQIVANTATTASGLTPTYTYYNGVNCSGTALSGAPTNVGNYSVKVTTSGNGSYDAGSKCVTHTITKKTNPLVVSANSNLTYTGSGQDLVSVSDSQGKVYYSTTTALTSSNYSTSGSETIPTGINASTYIVYYYTPGNSNYSEKSGNVSVTIAKKSVAVSWGTTTAFTYNGSGQAPTASVATGVTGETMTVNRTTQTNASDTSYTSTASCASVSGGQKSCDNYTLTSTTKAFTIGKKAVTVTAASASKTYDGTALTKTSGCSVTTGSLVSGHQATCTNSGTRTSAGSVANTLSTVVIKTSGGTDVTANYDITKANGTLTVNKKSIAVSWGTTTAFTYNGSGQAPTASVATGVTGETMTVNRTTQTNASDTSYTSTASCASVSGGQKTCNNYTLTNTTKTFTISKAQVTVTAASASKTYDGTALTKTSGCSVTTGSLVSGHQATCTNSGTRTNAGSATNTLSTAVIKNSGGTDVSANYTITKANGTLSVSRKSVEVSWGTTTAFTYNGSGQGPTASVATGVTGETMTVNRTTQTNASDTSYTSTASCASVSGGQKSCNNYTLTNTTKSFTIGKKAVTVTAASASKTYDGTALTKTSGCSVTTGSLVSGHQATCTNSGTRTSAGSVANTLSTVVIKTSGGTDVTANYDITKANGTLTVNKKSIAVSWGTTTAFTYNGSEQAPTASVTTGVTGETMTVNRTTQTNASDTSYTSTASCASVSGGQKSCNNYTLTNTTKTFTIGKKAVTVTAASASKTYDGTALTKTSGCSVTTGSLVSGHTVTCTNSGTITNAGSTTNTLSTVVIKTSGGTDVTANYDITKANGTLTVNKKTDTITVTAKTSEATGSAIAATFSATSKTTVTPTYYSDSNCATKTTTSNAASAGGAPKTVGTYYATATSVGNTNYSAGTLTCTKAVTITANTNNNLSSLSVSGYSISPEFSAGTLEYTLTVEAPSITINATAATSLSTVSGTGTVYLWWNTKDIIINVTSQSGSVKAYKITVTNTKPTAPTITGGSNNWSSSAKTISVSKAGSAISGVQQYEYYTSTSTSAPTNSDLISGIENKGTYAIGTTTGNLSVGTNGTTYIWYRTVSNNNLRSDWTSSYQTVKVDTENPTTPTLAVSNFTINTTSLSYNISSSSSDSVSGISKFVYSTDNGSNWMAPTGAIYSGDLVIGGGTSGSTSKTMNLKISQVKNDNHTVKVRVYDETNVNYSDSTTELILNPKRIYIGQLYQQILGRIPDKWEMDYWDSFQYTNDIAHGLAISSEALERLPNKEDYVRALYAGILGNILDPNSDISNIVDYANSLGNNGFISYLINSDEFKLVNDTWGITYWEG